MMPVRGLQDSQQQQPSCSEQIKAAWQQVPLFCRFIFISTIGLYLLSWVIPSLIMMLITQPAMVVYRLQSKLAHYFTCFVVWRLISGPFVHPELLYLLFSLLSYIPTAMRQEKLDGTVKHTFRFFVIALIIESMFVAVCLLISLGYPRIMTQVSIGLWPILFCDIVTECNRSPEVSRNLCCLPIQIKSKYYPWVLIVLFSVFFGPQLSLFVGMLVGYMCVYGYLKFLDLATAKSKLWESRFPFKNFQNQPQFVSTDGATGGSQLPTFVRSNPPNVQQNSRQNQPQQNQFQAFQGRGVQLGATSAQTNSRSSSQSYGSTTNSNPQDNRNRNVASQSSLVNGANGKGNLNYNEMQDESKDQTFEDSSRTNEDVGQSRQPPATKGDSKTGDKANYSKVRVNTSGEDEEDNNIQINLK